MQSHSESSNPILTLSLRCTPALATLLVRIQKTKFCSYYDIYVEVEGIYTFRVRHVRHLATLPLRINGEFPRHVWSSKDVFH